MKRSSRQQYDEFRGRFRQGLISMAMGEDGADSGVTAARPRWGHLRNYFRWLRPFRAQIGLVFVLALTASLLGLLPPLASRFIIDDILVSPDPGMTESRRFTLLHIAGASVLLLLLVQQGIEAVRNFKMNQLNLRVLRRLQQRLFDHLMRLPIHELQTMKTGGIVTRVSNDVDDVSGLLQMAVITPGVAAFRVVATMIVLMCLQWRMAVVAAAILVPVIAINMLWIRKLKPLHREIRRDRGELNARVVETFGGLPVVRVFRRERKEARDFAVGQGLMLRKRMLIRMYYLAISTGWGLLVPLSGLLIVWYGGTLHLVNYLTTGDIFAFQMFAFLLMMPISQIVQSWSDTQLALAALDRTIDILQRAVDLPDRPGACGAPARVERFEFRDVVFGYRADTPVLKGVSFDVDAGQMVALVGRSGAGKTTLTNLVARFYDPTGGAILLNGQDLRDIKRDSYRSLLGMVQQDVFLFDGTIRENIAYGRRGASLEEVVDAARQANAHPFIAEFRDGYDTLIGERGIKLSGGQRQRISIARAILADPQILILDEATSNLDTESEQLIQASLVALFEHRTTFVIAHRLSTVIRADLILVMEGGRIVERGTHAELMKVGSVYAEMVERQMRVHAEHLDIAREAIDWSD